MNAILGFAQLLTMSYKDPLTPNQKERVKQIVKGGQHLLDLINEILDISLSKRAACKSRPNQSPSGRASRKCSTSPRPWLPTAASSSRSAWEQRSNPYVMADRQRLKQVLLNLLNNAVKYNRPGGFVVVTCEQPAQTAQRGASRSPTPARASRRKICGFYSHPSNASRLIRPTSKAPAWAWRLPSAWSS